MPFARPPRAAALRMLLAGALVGAAATLGGCRDLGDVTGSIGASRTMPSDNAALREYSETWGQRYQRNPGEKTASITYARALRALTRYDEAAAVMQAAAVKSPQDFEVLGAYGKALADDGKFAQAKDVLSRAYPEDRPDWDILSVQGSVADRLGDHAAALGFYRASLKIAPGEPRVLSNLGLSYALARQLPQAEEALRQAAASSKADSRVRGNLALILALEGKFGDAEEVSRADMSPDDAKANVESIRRMIAQNDSWRELQKPASAGRARPAAGKVAAGDGAG